MSWHISEALSDLSLIPIVLANWRKDIDTIELEKLISDSDINVDLIDDEDIPAEYNSNIYNWLANDMESTLYNAGLVTKERLLTDIAQGIVGKNLSFYDALTASIFKEDNNPVLLKFLDLLKKIQEDENPYSGLILIESCLAFQELDKGSSIDDCLNLIRGNRGDESDGEIKTKTNISDLIIEKYKIETIDIIHTQTTLIWLIANSFGSYGDLFEIQHIYLPDSSQKRLLLCQDNTDPIKLYKLLTGQS